MRTSEPLRPPAVIPESFAKLEAVTAGFSQRRGGVSEAPYRSLNLGLSTGDEDERVLENRRRLFASLGVDTDRLAVAGQVHGSDVLVVSEPGQYPGYDGLVTTASNVVLCMTSADCAVVLLADPSAGVVAACHSGWRGTLEDVAGKTVRRMLECGADPKRLRAYVSPCICVEHFEVGDEVANRFRPEYVARHADWPRPHVDLKAAIGDQLARAGLAEDAIEISHHCSFEETDTFYSYRAEHGTTGRMMGFILLNP